MRAIQCCVLLLSSCLPPGPEDVPELELADTLTLGSGCINPADLVVDNQVPYLACSGAPGQGAGALSIVDLDGASSREVSVGGFPVSVAVSGQLALLGDGSGGGRLFATLLSGTVLADQDSAYTLCPEPYMDTVTALLSYEGRVVAGCGGGRVLRFEAASGSGGLDVTVLDQATGALGIAAFAQWGASRAVAADWSSPSLSQVELGSTFAVEQRWSVPAGPVDVAVRGDLVAVAAKLARRVAALDLITGETIFSVEIGDATEDPVSVAFFDDDTIAVALQNSREVVALDASSGELLGAVSTQGSPRVVRPAGDGRVYAAVAGDGTSWLMTVLGPR